MTRLSRREFAALTAAAAAAPFALGRPASAAALTAKDLIDRITAQIGVPWKADTVDGLKAGDPGDRRHRRRHHRDGDDGRAAAGGEGRRQRGDLEPADVLRQDGRADAAGAARPGGGPPGGPPPAARRRPLRRRRTRRAADPVFTAKNAFIDQHRLVIVRLSDHWRLRGPDPFAIGLAQAMGWAKHKVAGDARRYDVRP